MSRDIQREKEIRKYIRENLHCKPYKIIAQDMGKTENAIKKIAGRMGISRRMVADSVIINAENNDNSITQTKEDAMGKKKEPEKKKTGLEIRDGYVINHTNRTIITDLGEFGTYVCNVSTHGAIQRYYVDNFEGKGHTATATATKFEFYNNKAVWKYAKIHNFTKSSPGQTDLEFEMGLTAEEASEESWRAEKRRSIKIFEQKKWKETQRDADRWNNFENSVFLPMKDWVEEHLPKYRPPKFKPKTDADEFIFVAGPTDLHYLKHCYDFRGRTTYDKKIAKFALEKANTELISEVLRHGKPEMIYVPSGTDNLTIDNTGYTTTAGTSQTGQITGNFIIDMEDYVNMTIGMYEMYSQIAPVTIIPMPGNHDRHTSFLLHILLQKYFEGRDDVTVLRNMHTRTYVKYGKNGIGFGHGDDMSPAKWKREAHKLFLVEAREQGVNLNVAKNLLLFLGHIHTDSFEDLGGVKLFKLPALPPPDEWHRKASYIGNALETAGYIIDKKSGRKTVIYAS